MKLLLDQNLPRQLVGDMQPHFPGSAHVWPLGLAEASDEEVWAYAAEQGFVIVSKDTDFIHQAMLRGHPPKVIYLKVGNCSTRVIREIILSRLSSILDFLGDPVESLLILQ
ncbi:MAG: DUF5615 family PIN-like protein [bacterium]